jgi:hypothetical protein
MFKLLSGSERMTRIQVRRVEQVHGFVINAYSEMATEK